MGLTFSKTFLVVMNAMMARDEVRLVFVVHLLVGLAYQVGQGAFLESFDVESIG